MRGWEGPVQCCQGRAVSERLGGSSPVLSVRGWEVQSSAVSEELSMRGWEGPYQCRQGEVVSKSVPGSRKGFLRLEEGEGE